MGKRSDIHSYTQLDVSKTKMRINQSKLVVTVKFQPLRLHSASRFLIRPNTDCDWHLIPNCKLTEETDLDLITDNLVASQLSMLRKNPAHTFCIDD